MKKPTSPHLSVYSPQISSVLSIAHRLSGLGLVVASPLLVWGMLALGFGEASFGKFLMAFSQWFGLKLVLMLGVVAFCYHLLNGIRHLVWDIGFGFSLWQMRVSGILTLVAALGLSAYVMKQLGLW